MSQDWQGVDEGWGRRAVDFAALSEPGNCREYTSRRYLDAPPTTAELESVLARLGLEPWDIARMTEPVAKEIALREVPKDEAHRGDWVAALVENPKLIQRPIITLDDGTAVVARDPETLARIIDGA